MTSQISLFYARTPLARIRGLLGKPNLPPGEGLVITPCNAIHTIRMKFALDVRFFDKKGNLVRVYTSVPPGKCFLWGGFKAYSVLETQAGDPAFAHLTQLPNEEK